MDLTPKEAARYLGKSERMVRYLLKQGKLAGNKVMGQWRIPREALEPLLSDPERARRRQRAEDLKGRIEDALTAVEPAPADGKERGFYSVRDLRLFGQTLDELHATAELAARDPAAAEALAPVQASLRAFLRHLSDGTHQYAPEVKLDRLTRARSALCSALTDVLCFARAGGGAEATALADRLEGTFLRSLNGLLRRAERRRRARTEVL